MDTITATPEATTGNAANIAEFRRLYIAALAHSFAHDPEYGYAASKTTPEALADKMLPSLVTGGANKDGAAIRMVCKQLGIKHTYTAMRQYFHAA